MARHDLIRKQDYSFGRQLLQFKEHIGEFATALGVSPAQVTVQAADADYFEYVSHCHLLHKSHVKALHVLKRGLRRSRDTGQLESLAAEVTLPVAVPAVAAGMEKRFRTLVRQLKLNANYTTTIGLQLGVEAGEQSAPDLTAVQPVITATVSGDHVVIGWDWQGLRAFLDLCEIQVDRSDGKGFVSVMHSVIPGSVDQTKFPAEPTIWRYRAIYHVGDQQVGQWSQIASVMVPP